MTTRPLRLVARLSPVGTWALAVLGPVAVAAAFVPLRAGSSSGLVALCLVAVVLVSAIAGGRLAATASALVGAVAFDVLHTTPYGQLRMDDPTQVEVLLVFVLVAFVVGELGHAAAHARQHEDDAQVREARLLRLLTLVDAGQTRDELVEATRREVADELGREVAWADGPPDPTCLRLRSDGTLIDEHGADASGTTHPWCVPVACRDTTVGHLRVSSGATDLAQRLETWTLAATLALAVAPAGRPEGAAPSEGGPA